MKKELTMQIRQNCWEQGLSITLALNRQLSEQGYPEASQSDGLPTATVDRCVGSVVYRKLRPIRRMVMAHD